MLAAQPMATPKSKAPAHQGTTSQQGNEIKAAIRAKLAKSKIGKDGFNVRVQGGIAYLSGSTNVVQHKGSATRMAKSAGAKAVVNQIKVSDAPKQSAAANLERKAAGAPKPSGANRGLSSRTHLNL